jgi:hypothetical protein
MHDRTVGSGNLNVCQQIDIRGGFDMSEAPSIKELMLGVSKKMKIDFEKITKQIPHRGKRGEGREEVLIHFLRQYLPDRFGAHTGFVVDSFKNVSKQTDIVIYDKMVSPIFKVTDEERIFPIECVCAVVEVRSLLNTEGLTEMAERIRLIKKLDKTCEGTRKALLGGGYGIGPLKRETYHDQVFGAVFAYDSISLHQLQKTLYHLNKEVKREFWTNLICVLNKGIISYMDGNGMLSPNPMIAKKVYSTIEREREVTLLVFYSILTSFLSGAHVSDSNIFRYLEVERSKTTNIDIDY